MTQGDDGEFQEDSRLYTKEKDRKNNNGTINLLSPSFTSGEELPPILPTYKIMLLNLSWLGISMLFLLLSLEVIPAQIKALVGADMKGRVLGGMVAGGAVLTFLVSPVIGMKSDRVVSQFGKRRPVMLGGVLGICIGLLGMALSAPKTHLDPSDLDNSTLSGNGTICTIDLVAKRCAPYWANNKSLPHLEDEAEELPHGQPGSVVIGDEIPNLEVEEQIPGSLGLYIFFYLVMSTCLAGVTVPYSALIADESNPTQRGLNSGVMGGMTLVGNVLGALLGLFFVQLGVLPTYGISSILFLACILTTVFTTSENPATKPTHEPMQIKQVFTGFWEPLKDTDFRWVFLTRFFMQQGISTVTGFLEYWLSDMIVLPNCWSPERSVAFIFMPLLIAAVASCIICGVLSDKIRKRKPIVILGGLLMCVASFIMAFLRGEYVYYAGLGLAFIFGVGYGCYNGVDFALVMDVLPEERDKAKDIAVWQQALVLPQALATPIGGLVLDLFEQVNCEIGLGYMVLFILTAVYYFCSGIFVVKIKGVD